VINVPAKKTWTLDDLARECLEKMPLELFEKGITQENYQVNMRFRAYDEKKKAKLSVFSEY